MVYSFIIIPSSNNSEFSSTAHLVLHVLDLLLLKIKTLCISENKQLHFRISKLFTTGKISTEQIQYSTTEDLTVVNFPTPLY